MQKVEKAELKKMPSRKSLQKNTDISNGGIKKEYLKSRSVCKVLFRLPCSAAPDAKNVRIVGDFNGWSNANPMKRLKNGDYSITLELDPGREYQFRYLIDESKWENDHYADRYIRSPYGDCDNSVVAL